MDAIFLFSKEQMLYVSWEVKTTNINYYILLKKIINKYKTTNINMFLIRLINKSSIRFFENILYTYY